MSVVGRISTVERENYQNHVIRNLKLNITKLPFCLQPSGSDLSKEEEEETGPVRR